MFLSLGARKTTSINLTDCSKILSEQSILIFFFQAEKTVTAKLLGSLTLSPGYWGKPLSYYLLTQVIFPLRLNVPQLSKGMFINYRTVKILYDF